jgi:hypothetical protein
VWKKLRIFAHKVGKDLLAQEHRQTHSSNAEQGIRDPHVSQANMYEDFVNMNLSPSHKKMQEKQIQTLSMIQNGHVSFAQQGLGGLPKEGVTARQWETLNICGDTPLHTCVLLAYQYLPNTPERAVLLNTALELLNR